MPKKFEPGTEKPTAQPEWGNRTMALYAVPDELAAKLTTATSSTRPCKTRSRAFSRTSSRQETVEAKDERTKIERMFDISEVTTRAFR